MKLLPNQTDEASLLRVGRGAVLMFEKGDFRSVADQFGYALAFGRSPAVAVEEEFRSCIVEFQASTEPKVSVIPSMTVKYFEPNESGLFALIECVFAASGGCPILAELIVASSGVDRFVTLEQVSLAGL